VAMRTCPRQDHGGKTLHMVPRIRKGRGRLLERLSFPKAEVVEQEKRWTVRNKRERHRGGASSKNANLLLRTQKPVPHTSFWSG